MTHKLAFLLDLLWMKWYKNMQQIFLAIFCLLEVETIYVGCLNISWQVVQKNLSKASWFDISTVLFIYYSFMCTKIGGLF